MDPTVARILDANANRAREALRVLEDYARFALNDAALSEQLKQTRHTLATALTDLQIHDALLARDTPSDVGTTIKTDSELRRESLADVIIAAGKRLSEALRVLEECAKIIHPVAARSLEKIRYDGYSFEQTLTRIILNAPLQERFAQVRLYVLLTGELCHNSVGGWEQTLGVLLQKADAGIVGTHALCIQLREKNLPDREFLARAKVLAAKCRAAGAISIINDRPDIALLANADGIHLGQTDLPCTEARKLLGASKIIGVSTENLDQARQAVRDGATYIAAGPMFPTQTKQKPRIAGPDYALQAQNEIPLPIVPIGGITLENLHELTARKLPRVAVCSAIIANADPAAQTRSFLKKLS